MKAEIMMDPALLVPGNRPQIRENREGEVNACTGKKGKVVTAVVVVGPLRLCHHQLNEVYFHERKGSF